jgi:hypothetical protein
VQTSIHIITFALVLLALIIPPGGPFWPLHNVVNTCICVVMVRALQLDTLPPLLLLLSALSAYDFVAVRGTQVLSDQGQSVMEAVATAKLGLQSQISDNVQTIVSSARTVSPWVSTIGMSGIGCGLTIL